MALSRSGRDKSVARDVGLFLFSPEPDATFLPGYSLFSSTGGALALPSVMHPLQDMRSTLHALASFVSIPRVARTPSHTHLLLLGSCIGRTSPSVVFYSTRVLGMWLQTYGFRQLRLRW